MVEKNYEPIPDFYAGKSVFITGGGGYLGKVLIEKLLYSCPEVDRVYVLLRDKKNVSAEARLQHIIDLPLFSRLRNERPQALDKLVLVKGDVSAKNLNMTPEILDVVTEKVSIVIHSAAVVKFNSPLKAVLDANVEGTRHVLDLCRLMKKIHIYAHVSTAYSNPIRSIIEEQIYPPPVSIEEAYKFAQETHTEAEITKFLNGLPNTYTLTKALAEHLISETHGDIPAVIIRPSVVTPSKDEPLKGWVDNWFGSTGLVTTVAKGVCRVVLGDGNNVLDLIPVDYVCNHTLVAAARSKRQREVAVYNACSSSSNPVTLLQFRDLYCDAAIKHNLNELPYPHVTLVTRRYWLVRLITLLSYMVAYIADVVVTLTRNIPRYVELVTQTVMIRNATEYFTMNSWIIKNEKSTALYETLSPQDAETFPFLATDINWEEYFSIYVQGVCKYLLKETPIPLNFRKKLEFRNSSEFNEIMLH